MNNKTYLKPTSLTGKKNCFNLYYKGEKYLLMFNSDVPNYHTLWYVTCLAKNEINHKEPLDLYDLTSNYRHIAGYKSKTKLMDDILTLADIDKLFFGKED